MKAVFPVISSRRLLWGVQLFGIHMLAVAQTLNVNIQIKFIQQAACFPWNITLSIHKRLNLKRNI